MPEALLSAELSNAPKAKRDLMRGMYRYESKSEGVLACIDTERPLGLVELSRSLQAFAKTGDSSAVGQLRYVLARRDGAVTSLLVLWTDGSAPLLTMFPKAGDAPGRDVSDVPRPKDSARLLSASDLGAPYSITVYRSEKVSPVVVYDWYVKTLTERGWRVTEAKTGSLIARRGARTIFVRTTTVASGGTTTSILELS